MTIKYAVLGCIFVKFVGICVVHIFQRPNKLWNQGPGVCMTVCLQSSKNSQVTAITLVFFPYPAHLPDPVCLLRRPEHYESTECQKNLSKKKLL